jgi:hypothetical protein
LLSDEIPLISVREIPTSHNAIDIAEDCNGRSRDIHPELEWAINYDASSRCAIAFEPKVY